MDLWLIGDLRDIRHWTHYPPNFWNFVYFFEVNLLEWAYELHPTLLSFSNEPWFKKQKNNQKKKKQTKTKKQKTKGNDPGAI